MVILYTAADFVLQYFTSIEVSPTLTTAWFAFWGGEAGFLTCIKISKVLKGEALKVSDALASDDEADYTSEEPYEALEE
jgi:hypothetical protein